MLDLGSGGGIDVLLSARRVGPGSRVRPSGPGRVCCTSCRIIGVRAVVSRVSSASVTVADEVVGAIDRGLLALVGVTHADTADAARELARKIHELRIFPGEGAERSAADLGLPVLVVSQFTLYGDTRKGRRPSWTAAAPGPAAEPLVDLVVAELRARGAEVATGRFGAAMAVASVNDGPFTLQLEVPAPV